MLRGLGWLLPAIIEYSTVQLAVKVMKMLNVSFADQQHFTSIDSTMQNVEVHSVTDNKKFYDNHTEFWSFSSG